MKVAIVHYWLVSMRGGEKVLEVLCNLYPQADIYTLVVDRDKLSPTISRHRITASFLQHIGGRKYYQRMLPLMPFALESFDLTEYDLVLSSEAGPAKGVITRPDALHICYCHSPMRYVWDLYPQYYKQGSWLVKMIMAITGPFIRQWDVTTAARVDHYVANSHYVAKRINKFYRREASVINPPVDTSRFKVAYGPGEFYLCAGQITPYKRIDIAVDAFTQLGLPLVVMGGGASAELRKRAGSNVKFLGAVDNATMEENFFKCKALIFPGVEDFGIVPLEVLASGRPVIAYAAGGALETVIPGKTGILFKEQTPDSLIAAVHQMEESSNLYYAQALREFAEGFETSRFEARLKAFIDQKLQAALTERT